MNNFVSGFCIGEGKCWRHIIRLPKRPSIALAEIQLYSWQICLPIDIPNHVEIVMAAKRGEKD